MNDTTHPVAPEEVMAFLDGELSLEHAQTVSMHIGQCPECQKVRESLGSASQSLGGWTVPAVPGRVAEQVSQGSPDTNDPPGNPFASVLRRFLGQRATLVWGGAVLAALVIFLAASFDFRAKVGHQLIAPAGSKAVTLSAEPPTTSSYQGKLPASSGSVGGVDFATATFDHSTSSDIQGRVLAQPSVRSNRGQGGGGGAVDNFADEGETSQERKEAWTPSGPMIARTVALTMVVKDFDAGRASLDAILARHNGYAASLNVSTPQDAARVMQASLRIPAPQLAAALGELKALGRVENETQNGEEVTQQHADLLARLKNSRETEQRLQDVLRTRTGKVKDVLEVEEEIARVRGEIEQMEAEQKTLEHRVDFASIDLRLAEEYKAQLNTPAPSVLMRLRNATVNGFRNAFENLLGIALFFAESGPSLVLWVAILGFPAWLLWRRYRRAHALGSLGA